MQTENSSSLEGHIVKTVQDVSEETPSSWPEKTHPSPTKLWHWIALGAILLLSAFLNSFQLEKNEYGNTYYAAAVKSMMQSWHNFFFVSFDPGGFVTVDKPPLGLWIQTLSATVFGFSSLSLLLPQAIAGLLSVLVLYQLVRRTFGPVAGLLAALALALTPITVVMNRDNNLDPLLVLALLLATWAVLRATETGKLRWLALGMFLVGLGFNIKTLEAYLALPALVLLYLLGARQTWMARFWRLGVALLLLLVVSFAWITIVDLTPASERPYVGSSQSNSELDLTLGYNGLTRLSGMNNRGSGQTQSFGGGGSPFNEGGPASPFRLLKVELGGQVSWLLPLALCGLVALAWQRRWRFPLDRGQQFAQLWGIWLLTTGAFFSVAGFFHSYYLVIIAPAICALAAAGLVTLWYDYQERTDWRRWALPVALLLTAAEQGYLLSAYQDYNGLEFAVVALCVLAAGVLVWLKIPSGQTTSRLPVRTFPIIQRAAVTLGLLALLLTPSIWDGISLSQPGNSLLPTGGPQVPNTMSFGNFPGGNNSPGGNGFPGGTGELPTGGFPGGNNFPGGGNFSQGVANMFTQRADSKLINYLQTRKRNAKFLVATLNATSAAPIIIETGEPVMAMGGFLGSDPILTEGELASLVKAGTVRYFLIQGIGSGNMQQILEQLPEATQEQFEQMLQGGSPGGFGGNSALTNWVTTHCSSVPETEWSSSASTANTPQGGSPGMGGMGQQLYDCGKTQ